MTEEQIKKHLKRIFEKTTLKKIEDGTFRPCYNPKIVRLFYEDEFKNISIDDLCHNLQKKFISATTER